MGRGISGPPSHNLTLRGETLIDNFLVRTGCWSFSITDSWSMHARDAASEVVQLAGVALGFGFTASVPPPSAPGAPLNQPKLNFGVAAGASGGDTEELSNLAPR